MIHIIDNRRGIADLEILEDGYGKWYVDNSLTGKIIATKYKWEALEIKQFPEFWDI